MTYNSATSSQRYDALWGIKENQVDLDHAVAWKDLVQINMRHNFVTANPSFSHDATNTMALQTEDSSSARIEETGMREILAWVAKQAPLAHPNWKEQVASSQTVPKNFEQQITVFFDHMRSLIGSGTLKYDHDVDEFWPWFTAILENINNANPATHPSTFTPAVSTNPVKSNATRKHTFAPVVSTSIVKPPSVSPTLKSETPHANPKKKLSANRKDPRRMKR